MNYQSYQSALSTEVVILSVVFLSSFFVFLKRWKYLLCKKDLETKIQQNASLPIELLKGVFKVVEKIGDSFLIVTPFNKHDGIRLKVNVPRMMFNRVKESCVYYIYYDYKKHEIHFDSDTSHTEDSNLIEEDMKEDSFPLKTKILAKLIN
jgi:hypothetical protein